MYVGKIMKLLVAIFIATTVLPVTVANANAILNDELIAKFHSIQRRVMDYNGITMVDKFDHKDDYKSKMRPGVVILSPRGGYAKGNGLIYISDKEIKRAVENHIHLAILEGTIAHEMAHNLNGHEVFTKEEQEFCRGKSEQECDEPKETVAAAMDIAMTAKLPEGGMGGFVAGINQSPEDVHENATWNVLHAFEKKTSGKIRFDYANDSMFTKGGNHFTTSYVRRTGKKYEIWCLSDGEDSEKSYLAGQFAYCVAMGAMSYSNLDIVEQKELPAEGNFVGEYFLICRSPKLPNGYKVLAAFNNLGSGNKALLLKLLKTPEYHKVYVDDTEFSKAYNKYVLAMLRDYAQYNNEFNDERREAAKKRFNSCEAVNIIMEIALFARDIDNR